MLKDHASSAIVAVSDLARAKAFYSDTLGLELDSEGAEEGVLVYRTGATRLVVYRSGEAGHNRGNAVVWGVGDDIDAIVAALEARARPSRITRISASLQATSTTPGARSWSGSRIRTATSSTSTPCKGRAL